MFVKPSKRHIALALLALLLAVSVPFSRTALAQYDESGNPCPVGTQGTADCNFDANGNPVSDGPRPVYGIGDPHPLPDIGTHSGCSGTAKDLGSLLCIFTGMINAVLPMVATLTLIVFLWGLVTMIRNSGDVKEVEKGKKVMIWGIVGLFVMFSVWGILNIMLGEFFGTTVGIPQLPE